MIIIFFKWRSTDFENQVNDVFKEHYTDLKFILNPRNSLKYNQTNPINTYLFQSTLDEKGKMISFNGDTGLHKSTSAVMMFVTNRIMIKNYCNNTKGMLRLLIKHPHIHKRFLEIKQEIDNKKFFNWDNIKYSNYEISDRLDQTKNSVDYFIKDESNKDFGENSRITAMELSNQIQQQARKRVWHIAFCSPYADNIPHHFRLLAYDYGKAYTQRNGQYLFDCTRFIVIKQKEKRSMITGYYISRRLPSFIEDNYLKYNKECRVGNDSKAGTMFVNEKMKKYVYLVKELYPKKVIQDCIDKLNLKQMSKGEFVDIITRVCSRKLSTTMARTLMTYLNEIRSFGGVEEWQSLNAMK